MTSRAIATVCLLASAFAAAPLSAAQAQLHQPRTQLERCQGGWEVDRRDKVAACTAVIDGKQLEGDDIATAYYFRGEALKDMAQWDKAMADLTEAIRLAPDAAASYAARGDLFSNTDKFDQAIADFDRAIQLEPKDGYLFRQRGDAYEGKGMHAQAIADYDAAIRLDPDDDLALSSRCKLEAILGQQRNRDCSATGTPKPGGRRP